MKIAILGDTHFGARNDHALIAKAQREFLDRFFADIEERGITTAVHLGDVFDRRKYLNIQTLNWVKKRFIEPSERLGLHWHTIIGNHDTYFKNTNDVSSVQEILAPLPSFTVYTEPEEVQFEHFLFGFVPWVNRENHDRCLKFVKKTKANILCGHFEINGFEMNANVLCNDGLERNVFSKFPAVLSGHFHKKHTQDNIHYLGTPYPLTFGDFGQPKGYHILDTETGDLEFIENEVSIFKIIKYDDQANDYDFETMDFSDYRDCFVKVIVVEKKNPYAFDRMLSKLYDTECFQIRIVDTTLAMQEGDGDIHVDMTEDTLSLIRREIDGMDNVDDPDRLKKVMSELFVEAINL
jgi:DNA repair exonuclease SbcCD nuclease subunit